MSNEGVEQKESKLEQQEDETILLSTEGGIEDQYNSQLASLKEFKGGNFVKRFLQKDEIKKAKTKLGGLRTVNSGESL